MRSRHYQKHFHISAWKLSKIDGKKSSIVTCSKETVTRVSLGLRFIYKPWHFTPFLKNAISWKIHQIWAWKKFSRPIMVLPFTCESFNKICDINFFGPEVNQTLVKPWHTHWLLILWHLLSQFKRLQEFECMIPLFLWHFMSQLEEVE